MGQPVVHFEIIGKDVERLHGFYSDLFGCGLFNDPEGHVVGVVKSAS
jgi:hypothetical protein